VFPHLRVRSCVHLQRDLFDVKCNILDGVLLHGERLLQLVTDFLLHLLKPVGRGVNAGLQPRHSLIDLVADGGDLSINLPRYSRDQHPRLLKESTAYLRDPQVNTFGICACTSSRTPSISTCSLKDQQQGFTKGN